MFVELPEQYELPFGEIKDGILVVYDLIKFGQIMFELTYCLKEKKCIYCGKELQDAECTLDHLYPLETGGISITNNLSPCCYKCNNTKSNLTYKEFIRIMQLPKNERKKALEEIAGYDRVIKKKFGYKLPRRWVTYQDVETISCEHVRKYVKGRKYTRLLNFFIQNRKFPEAVTIDRNNRILGGYTVILLSRQLGVKQVPVIKLENVELLCDEPAP
jgi:hypothetical protein